jgi:MoxR-like ATPase
MQPAAVRDSAKRISEVFKSLEKVVIGRHRVLQQLMFALVTKNHMLLEGPPGVAKSYMTNKLFAALQDATHFKVQCTKKMTEDYIVGPLDMHLFREQGEYLHRIEGYLPEAQYAFLDEFLDLSTGALRALLEILNERTFSRGPQAVKCPLVTAVCATNFSGESDAGLEAVMDRFLFKAKITGLTRVQDRMAMFKSDDVKIPKMSHTDIMRVYTAAKRVIVPEFVLTTYLRMCEQLKLTDRTVHKAVEVIKASAVFSGRDFVILEDLTALELCFVKTGDNASEQAFSNSMKKYKEGLILRDSLTAASAIAARVGQLSTLLASAADYDAAMPTAVEVREAQNALQALRCAENTHIVNPSLHKCETLLNKADALFAKKGDSK